MQRDDHASTQRLAPILQQIHAMCIRLHASRGADTDAEPAPLSPDNLPDLYAAADLLERAADVLRQQQAELTDVRLQMLAETLYRQELLETAPDGYLITDAHGMIREVNQMAVTLLNVPRAALVGKPLAVFITQQDRVRFYAALNELRAQEAHQDLELQIQPRLAETFDALLTIRQIHMNDPYFSEGMTLNWTMRDITQQKLALDLLNSTRTEFERQVRDRTQELRATNQLLQTEIAERKRAQHAEYEQRVVADALRDTTLSLTSTLQFPEVLDQILHNLRRVVRHDAAAVLLLEHGQLAVARQRSYVETGAVEDEALPVTVSPLPLPIADRLVELMEAHSAAILSLRKGRQQLISALFPTGSSYQSLMGVPLLDQRAPVGMLLLVDKRANAFTAAEVQSLKSFAAAAVVAIKNATTHRQAGQLARFEERQRLARELHDAVSQTLFTASLIADTLPYLWSTDAAEAERQVSQLQKLSRGALAEMRTLLLELRPEQLAKADLRDNLSRLITTLQARTRLSVQFTYESHYRLAADVEFMFYRVAQEAFNNIIKHSLATQVMVDFTTSETHAELHIQDNGVGFKHERTKLGLGMETMRERAVSMGAVLTITSAAQQGTTIELVWPKPADAAPG